MIETQHQRTVRHMLVARLRYLCDQLAKGETPTKRMLFEHYVQRHTRMVDRVSEACDRAMLSRDIPSKATTIAITDALAVRDVLGTFENAESAFAELRGLI